MGEEDWIKVRLLGGPYDGAEHLFPVAYRERETIELVEPALYKHILSQGEVMVSYVLDEDEDGELIGRYTRD